MSKRVNYLYMTAKYVTTHHFVLYDTTYLLPDLLKADHICLKMRVDVKIVRSEKVNDRF